MTSARFIQHILLAPILIVFAGCATTSSIETPITREPGARSLGAEFPVIPLPVAGRSLLEAQEQSTDQVDEATEQSPAHRVHGYVPLAVHETPLRAPDLDRPPIVALLPTINELWDDYTRFDYDDVIEGASRLTAQANRPSWERAMALLLAGASSYLLGDAERALNYFVMAAETDPSFKPDAAQFPAPVIQLYNRASRWK